MGGVLSHLIDIWAMTHLLWILGTGLVFEGAKKSFVVSNNDERFILVGSSYVEKGFRMEN